MAPHGLIDSVLGFSAASAFVVVEGFLEDRFQRTRPSFGDLIGQPSRILGVFIFREFGYTR